MTEPRFSKFSDSDELIESSSDKELNLEEIQAEEERLDRELKVLSEIEKKQKAKLKKVLLSFFGSGEKILEWLNSGQDKIPEDRKPKP